MTTAQPPCSCICHTPGVTTVHVARCCDRTPSPPPAVLDRHAPEVTTTKEN